MEFNYQDRYSPKIENLLTSRSYKFSNTKVFTLSLSGTFIPNTKEYEYRISVPNGFSEEHKIKGTLEEMLPEFDRLVNLFAETYDVNKELEKLERQKLYKFSRQLGKENK